MSEQRNNRNKISGTLCAGSTPTESVYTLNESCPTVYDVKNTLVAAGTFSEAWLGLEADP
ncbi:Hypothetical protein FKW44_021180 [Caligus rogercresseyi]|uniref:Uncharacterized protein n=1 Tax=Caligus rogercresseyi TaxID=217165 RepID=A0A7T8GRG9_CALRO|nr:Hypothetical protein FKW44_021180 [Caligus rogercresseyi]